MADEYRILLVDDDEGFLESVGMVLERGGLRVDAVTDPESAKLRAFETDYDVMVIDYMMPETDGITLMGELLRVRPDAATLILTGYGTIENGIAAMKAGARDYLTKPIETYELLHRVRASAETSRLRRRAKELDSGIRRTERMRTTARFAEWAGRSLAGQLTAVLGYADFLRERLRDRDELYRCADNICQVARRTSGLLAALGTLSEEEEAAAARPDMDKVVLDAASWIQLSLGAHMTLRLDLEASGATVTGDAGRMRSVVFALAALAADRAGDAGVITVRTASTTVDRPGDDAGTADCVTVDVSPVLLDDAGGVDPGDGGASDAGVSFVRQSVMQCGGWLESDLDDEGRPAARICLPVVDAGDGSVETFDHGGVVLLADDDPVVRDVAQSMLDRLGFETIACGNGAEALDIFRERHEEISLVVLDIVMPNGNGPDTLETMREIDPDVSALACSGYASEMDSIRDRDIGFLAFLEKPFNIQELAAAVRQAVGE